MTLTPGVSSGRCQPCLLRLALDPAADDESEATDDGNGDTAGELEAGQLPTAPGRFGDYELIEPIGRGAMGVVFKACQLSLDRLVALKVLDSAGTLPPDAARRFRIEASAAAALRHPGIVTIHEVGVHQGRHYLAMDLIEGPTLATLVARQLLPADRAARLLASVADAIQSAHERGILHRDLKPSNILVDSSGQPRVADFGLAKRMHADADMTIPGYIMGSPNYMSPEQARGALLGPASDVHALGAVLYHCLSGRPPFIGQTIPDTLHHVIHGEPVALRLLVAGVPRDLDTITLKCLEKDPAKRYADARSLADDLRRFLCREPIRARPAGRPERVWRWCRRRPAVASLTAATALLVLAVAIGSPIAAFRIRAERERAEEATLRMRAERERAEDNLYAADMNLAQQAVEKSSRGQARALLERHRPASGQVDHRGFEWRYLWGQTETDEREITRVPAGRRHIVSIPGTTLVAADNSVWDTASTARPVFTLPSGSIAMAFDTTDGSLLVGGKDGLVSWTIANWQPRELMRGEIVHGVAFSMDGQWMATGGEQLRLWTHDEGSWRQIASRTLAFKERQNTQTLAFSPDGRSIVSGTGESWSNRHTLNFWSVPTLDPQPGLRAPPGDIMSVVFSPDGSRLVTGCWGGRIRVWTMDTMAEIATTMRHHGFVTAVTFSREDPEVFASSASDGTVRLWNVRTGTELVALQGPLDELWALTFADAGRTLLTLEQGGRVAIWETITRRRQGVLISHGQSTLPLGFSADGRTLATIDEAGKLRYWDVEQRREVDAMRRTVDLTGLFTRDFEIIAPAITRDLKTLAIGTRDGRVQFWRLPTGTLQTWSAHARRIRNLAFSPDGGTLATIGDEGIVKLWNVTSRALLAEVVIPGELAAEIINVPLVWSGDGATLALASATAIMLLDGKSGRLLRTLDPSELVYCLRFSPDGGVLVSGDEDHQLAFWDSRSGALLDRVHTSHQEGAYDLCFSPDGRSLVTVVDQVKLWSVATRQEVSTLRGHEHNIFAALFSPDGNLLVTADYEGAVRLWSAPPFEAIDGETR